MTLQLPWLTAPWSQVAQALQADRMPAGVLILGHAGLGRGRLVEAVARALLCLEPHADATACGRCAACREMDAGAHPDCLRVHPEEGKSAISIEQIRALARALSLTAGNRGRRCAIVSPAETLTREAANGFLKTLEEPPAGVTLILIADSTAHLLPTVTSRCLRLRVPTPAPEPALAWLNERGRRADWPLLLALAGGAPLAAERLAEEVGDDLLPLLNGLLAAATRRGEPLAATNGFAAWPLSRFAALIGWLAWALARGRLTGSLPADAAVWPGEIRELVHHADARQMMAVWREANRTANDAVAANPALARERLVLLFVNALDDDLNPDRRERR